AKQQVSFHRGWMRPAGHGVPAASSTSSRFPISERIGPMQQFGQSVVRFLKAEDGPTAVEYAVMLALIIVVCLVAITGLGTNANATFSKVSNAIQTSS